MVKILYIVFIVILFVAGIVFLWRQIERYGMHYILSLYNKGSFKVCKKETANYLRLFPKSVDAWLILGNIGLVLNDIPLSEKSFKKTLELAPESDKALVGMGVVLRNQQNFENAEDYYYKALVSNPDSSEAKSSLMLLEIYKNNHAVAISLGEDSVKEGLDQVAPSIIGNLMIAYHFNGDRRKRDELYDYLKEKEYKDLEFLSLIIEDKVSFKQIMEMENS